VCSGYGPTPNDLQFIFGGPSSSDFSLIWTADVWAQAEVSTGAEKEGSVRRCTVRKFLSCSLSEFLGIKIKVFLNKLVLIFVSNQLIISYKEI